MRPHKNNACTSSYVDIYDWATSSTRVVGTSPDARPGRPLQHTLGPLRTPLNARPGGLSSARKLPYLSNMPWSSYIQEQVGGKNNSMALNEDNSNDEPVAGAMAIQIALPMDTCLLTIAYRITVKLLSVRSNSHQRHGLMLDPLTHSRTVAN